MVGASRMRGNDTDQLALLAFKANIIDDPFQVLSTWNASIHFCEWQGVTCGRRHQRVTMLDLGSKKLTGSIPPQIGNLSFLRKLDLQNNSFVHEIPPELGRLPRLEILMLQYNSFSGKISANLSRCSNLLEFYVYRNKLGGAIPAELGLLSKLKIFYMAFNDLTGDIPHSFMNLTSLKMLYATGNNFGGHIPDGLGQLTNLTTIAISLNMLSGTIPPSIFNLSSLAVLDVGANNIHGSLPSNIGITLPNIQFLGFSDNQFIGSIPNSIANASNLEVLQIDDNNFTGKVPTMGNLYKLGVALFDNNSLGSGGPDDLHFLSSLTNATELRALTMDINKFGGKLPESINNLSTVLELFSFSENYILGSISTGIGNLISLNSLSMSGNQLTGYWSVILISESKLVSKPFEWISPLEVGNLKNLNALDVSENMLSGEIPSTLGSCVMLEFLYMQGNSFQGSMPSTLSFLKGIQELDLSRNNLSGKIPEYLTGFQLKKLNLSFNDFDGVVPIKGIFKNASATFLMRNPKLCGGVLELKLPKCNFKELKKSRSTLIVKLLVPLSCGLLGVILALCVLYLCCFRKSRTEISYAIPENSLLKVSYQSLLKATNGFSLENLMGAGSFGSVYKGVLDQDDGTVVAVKVLNLSRQGAFRSFIAECEALRNIRHRNLVKVVTACSGVDYQGNDFKALVYEFMSNGNLEEWLYPIQQEYEANEEPMKLSLFQRLNIAIDVASALNYLHHDCQSPIIHCDLKPSNILLNNEMTAHVGDFGLAQFRLNACSVNYSSIGLKGSIGYVAPEYGMGSEASTHGDVYSYGILLLEMFAGKRPTDEMFDDSLNLHNYIRMALPERVADVSEPRLLLLGEEGEMRTNPQPHDQSHANSYKIRECLISVFGVGIACSEESPSERLDTSEIVANLLNIKNKLMGTENIRGRRGIQI
ncbi:unnamed protein product [Ilex paraguariensis]|uniref:non-specific serine/threonine protein kinase n=1 Tax=Ilex paraguariensis TaxID=185542 RepID=A0ABC8RZY7_9AQUA